MPLLGPHPRSLSPHPTPPHTTPHHPRPRQEKHTDISDIKAHRAKLAKEAAEAAKEAAKEAAEDPQALTHHISRRDFLQEAAEAEAAKEAAEAQTAKEAAEDIKAKRRQTKATEYFSPSSITTDDSLLFARAT